MRRFRFVGDPVDYSNDFVNGIIYDSDYVPAGKNINAEWCATEYPSEWQEVFDNDGGTILTTCNPLHKDTDLGHFAGLAMQGILANEELRRAILMDATNEKVSGFEAIEREAIRTAKELIKQLNEEKK